MITWKESKGKYVINKGGVYLALSFEQVGILQKVLDDILKGDVKFYCGDKKND